VAGKLASNNLSGSKQVVNAPNSALQQSQGNLGSKPNLGSKGNLGSKANLGSKGNLGSKPNLGSKGNLGSKPALSSSKADLKTGSKSQLSKP
jgi:hypothetical protein